MSSELEGRTQNEESNATQIPESASVPTGTDSPGLPTRPSPYSDRYGKSGKSLRSTNWKARLAQTHREKRRMDQEAEMDAYKAMLTQADSELHCMTQLLEKTRDRKAQLTRFLCQFLSPTWSDALHKPRNTIEVNAPARISDMIIKTLKESQNSVCVNVRRAAANICSYRVTPAREANPGSAAPLKAGFYDTELSTMLAGPQTDKEGTVRQMLQTDLTGYGHNKRGMILFVNYRYDFPVANPLLLLASRWNFVLKEEAIVQYVEKRRAGWKKASAQRYSDYRRKYNEWRYKERRAGPAGGTSSELKPLRKIDIYNHEAHPLASPKPTIPGSTAPDISELIGSPLLSAQLRKESVELDPDLCKTGHRNQHRLQSAVTLITTRSLTSTATRTRWPATSSPCW